MRLSFLLLPLLAAAGIASAQNAAPAPRSERARAWWATVTTLAADSMEGREAGSEGHRRASELVARRFRELGLEPAGENGTFFQAVRLEERRFDLGASTAALARIRPAGAAPTRALIDTSEPLSIPGDIYFRATGGPPPERVNAPLVFVGYGFHLPEAGHDDFAGLDLRGKVAVVVNGQGPDRLSGALKSHARADRARQLQERGAVGVITVNPLGASEQNWSAASRIATMPGMYPADPQVRTLRSPFLTAVLNPASAARLFAGSGQDFAAISAAARAGRPIAGGALTWRFIARPVTTSRAVETRNVVARLPGSDPRLRGEHVLLSAHLDGLGISSPVNGDRIYNGALDNAAGVAALLDIAGKYRAERARPRRSILFVAVSGEEKGLLGSRWFARSPTVPRSSIVADLNYDMALPLFPLRSITTLGFEESSLGPDASAVGAQMGLPIAPDPFPERNSFVRSDQYSFIEEGIPSLAFKFGFAAGTPEARIEAAWRRDIYHSPQDDSSQRVFADDEIRLHDFIAALALRVANADARPRWNDNSFFRRFARE
ncbi:MAG TPA: M28 family peptidase [Allosphingosinicella sp.]|nr:M28 family peptidase [Allosphingosinicella sp.]